MPPEKQLKEFTCSYRFDGGEWGFTIYAEDHADAEKRLGALKSWGKVDGELIAKISGFGAGFWATVIFWVRNRMAT